MKHDDKVKYVKTNGLCFGCLKRNHMRKDCTKKKRALFAKRYIKLAYTLINAHQTSMSIHKVKQTTMQQMQVLLMRHLVWLVMHVVLQGPVNHYVLWQLYQSKLVSRVKQLA